MSKEFKEIKKMLLEDENIYKVNINSTRGLITVTPNQAESYLRFKDVFSNFLDRWDSIVLNNREFKIVGYDHFNTQIYSVTLKVA